MLETKWTAQICKELEACGAMVFAIVGSHRQKPGWPDRIVWHIRWRGLLEFKGERTGLGSLQSIIIGKLRLRGCCYVVRYPNLIQDEKGNVLTTFDGTGRGLLDALISLGLPEHNSDRT